MTKNKDGIEAGKRLTFSELNTIKAKQRADAKKTKEAPKAPKKAKSNAAESKKEA